MGLEDCIKKIEFDKRMVSVDRTNGVLDEDKYAQHLGALPDLSENCEVLSLVDEELEDSDTEVDPEVQ